MHDCSSQVLAFIDSADSIPREAVREWIAKGDLRTLGAVYALTAHAWTRITPELQGNEQCSFMSAYLLECLLKNPESEDFLHGGFEAAWELAGWLKHLLSLDDPEGSIRQVAQALRFAYLQSDDATRNRIETGVLEHVLQTAKLRDYFKDWSEHPTLAGAYERSLKWGENHPS